MALSKHCVRTVNCDSAACQRLRGCAGRSINTAPRHRRAHVSVPLGGRPVDGQVSLIVHRLDVGARLQQHAHNLVVVLDCCAAHGTCSDERACGAEVCNSSGCAGVTRIALGRKDWAEQCLVVRLMF